MSLVFLIYAGSILASTSLIGNLAENGFLKSALTRSVAGGTASITSANFLVGYTNLEYFISASANGALGLSGFIFIGGLFALVITWISNLLEYGVAVK